LRRCDHRRGRVGHARTECNRHDDRD
jgi:hypothetical protein